MEDFMVWKLAEKLGVSRCYDSLAALRRALEDALAQLPLQLKLGPSALDVSIHWGYSQDAEALTRLAMKAPSLAFRTGLVLSASLVRLPRGRRLQSSA
jgi:hypothetical protein